MIEKKKKKRNRKMGKNGVFWGVCFGGGGITLFDLKKLTHEIFFLL